MDQRDEKGRIQYTKNEMLLMDSITHYIENGLIKFPIFTQHRVPYGKTEYQIDFAIPTLKLGIEADGETFHSSPKQVASDKSRDAKLNQLGWTILRFTDEEIEEKIERVMSTIVKNIMQKESSLKNIQKTIESENK